MPWLCSVTTMIIRDFSIEITITIDSNLTLLLTCSREVYQLYTTALSKAMLEEMTLKTENNCGLILTQILIFTTS